MALALDIRYFQYCFRTELLIILDNITIIRSYYCCLYYDNYLKILGYGSSFTHLALTELVTTGLGRVGQTN